MFIESQGWCDPDNGSLISGSMRVRGKLSITERVAYVIKQKCDGILN